MKQIHRFNNGIHNGIYNRVHNRVYSRIENRAWTVVSAGRSSLVYGY